MSRFILKIWFNENPGDCLYYGPFDSYEEAEVVIKHLPFSKKSIFGQEIFGINEPPKKIQAAPKRSGVKTKTKKAVRK